MAFHWVINNTESWMIINQQEADAFGIKAVQGGEYDATDVQGALRLSDAVESLGYSSSHIFVVYQIDDETKDIFVQRRWLSTSEASTLKYKILIIPRIDESFSRVDLNNTKKRSNKSVSLYRPRPV